MIGPIIGNVTSNSVNIWIGDSEHKKRYAYCKFNDSISVQGLKVYNNNSTVFNFTKLLPDIEYEFIFAIDKKNVIFKDLKKTTIYVKTLKEEYTSCTIALASCHYPMPNKKSDKIFKIMKERLDLEDMAPIIFFVGDQIYADQLNKLIPIRRADTVSEFRNLYETKYQGEYFSKLCKEYSSLMTLDDHEIEDNWSMDNTDQRSKELFAMAIDSYKIYQHSLSSNNIDRLWYTYNIGKFNFFILDTRTERYNSQGNMLGDINNKNSQINNLFKWLKELPKDVPKFIVSSVIFAPISISLLEGKKCDNWNGYKTRDDVLKFIADNDIQKLVFLSGDVHHSLAVTMNLTCGNKEIKFYQIVSSPLFWPFPFANDSLNMYVENSNDVIKVRKFLFFKKKERLNINIRDSLNNKWKYNYISHPETYSQDNNFAIIKIDCSKMITSWYTNKTKDELYASFTINF